MEDLPREERLRGRDRIGEIFRDGTRASAGVIAARALRNPAGATRFAAIAGKAVGNAVKRNRMRRRLRAAYRTRKDAMPSGWDMVLMARPGLLEATWEQVCRDAALAAERAVRGGSGPRRSTPRP